MAAGHAAPVAGWEAGGRVQAGFLVNLWCAVQPTNISAQRMGGHAIGTLHQSMQAPTRPPAHPPTHHCVVHHWGDTCHKNRRLQVDGGGEHRLAKPVVPLCRRAVVRLQLCRHHIGRHTHVLRRRCQVVVLFEQALADVKVEGGAKVLRGGGAQHKEGLLARLLLNGLQVRDQPATPLACLNPGMPGHCPAARGAIQDPCPATLLCCDVVRAAMLPQWHPGICADARQVCMHTVAATCLGDLVARGQLVYKAVPLGIQQDAAHAA